MTTEALRHRLLNEANQCRLDGVADIAILLEDAAKALDQASAKPAKPTEAEATGR